MISKLLYNTTDKILKAHTKTINRLEALAEKRSTEAERLDSAIEGLMDKRDAHLMESLKAQRTAEKFRQLLD